MRIRIYFENFSNSYYAIYDDDEPDDNDRLPYGAGITPLDAELDLVKNYPRNPTIEERLKINGD